MTKEETNRSHKRRSEVHSEKREIRREEISPSISSHYCKSIVKRSHHKEDTDHKRYHRNEKEAKPPPDRHSRADQRQNSVGRREWRRRNSPVELVVRGCRNTDSSSSSEESEPERRQIKGRHSSRRRKREHEESFEELSRRKRRIESELNALDAEEAEAREQERRQRSNNRNHSAHKRTEHSRHHHEEKPVRIKQEPLSDDDRRQRRRHHSSETRRQGNDSRSRDENANWGRSEEQQQPEQPKEKPNFQTSGKLAEDTNTYNGVVIKYNEPSEARKPKRKWRLYPFKGDVSLPFIPIHRQSAYLLGRTRHIADIPIDHPSCSKQHAVLQFRLLPYEREDGTKGRSVRPYVIDLESSNGTYVNNKRIEPRRYHELFEKDVLKFGFSTRVYVILHEDSKNEDDNDDVEVS